MGQGALGARYALQPARIALVQVTDGGHPHARAAALGVFDARLAPGRAALQGVDPANGGSAGRARWRA